MMPNTADVNGLSQGTPEDRLLSAARSGDLAQVKEALAAGSDINARSYEDNTPLLLAAFENERKEVSVFLADSGADLTAMNDNEASVLMGFARAGWVDLMQRAIDAGCSVSHQDCLHEDAMSLASSREQVDAVAFLIQHGASPFRSVGLDEIDLSLKSEKTMAAALVAGMAVDLADEKGASLLMHAAELDSVVLCRTLIEHGASLDCADIRGWTPLAHAAFADAPNCFALLLEPAPALISLQPKMRRLRICWKDACRKSKPFFMPGTRAKRCSAYLSAAGPVARTIVVIQTSNWRQSHEQAYS